jgi:hypothetical protein
VEGVPESVLELVAVWLFEIDHDMVLELVGVCEGV